ncbi:GNAT family N-acetyltransferase [Croceicoccus sp. YJ47]|nr:GNAT family N-acetyltransferase [Croceicoccus sp. YJ47]
MPEHLEAANALSEEESWPHRLEDWQLFEELGEGIVATVDERVVGTIMAFRYGDRHATLGMLLEAGEVRERDIARMLMLAMLDRLGEDMNVMLSATPKRQSLFTSLGFVPAGLVHQHQGIAPSMPLTAPREDERVRPMGEGERDLPGLYCSATGVDRSVLFYAMARDSSGIVLTRDHEPVGFALLRRFGRGRVIAPIVAPDFEGAKLLATQMLGAQAGHYCRIDTVGGFGMSEWLESIGLPRATTVRTMVRGTLPVVGDGPRVYGIAGQAYG